MKTRKTNDSEYCSMAAIRYAKAMSELGIAEDAVMSAAAAFDETPELNEVLGNPVISSAKKHTVIDRIFPDDIKNFIKLVTDYGKIDSIEEIFRAYEEQKKKAEGIMTAVLYYVVPPTKEQLEKIEAFICREFGTDRVQWNMERKPELIGGFILHTGGKEYDYSMHGRLKRLEQKLTWR